MVVRGPLTDEERADMNSREPRTEVQKAEVRSRYIEGFEDYAENAMLVLYQRENMTILDRTLPTRADISSQAALYLDELKRLNEPPTPRLINLISMLLTGRMSPYSTEPSLDERPEFVAAVRYFVAHRNASDREIAREAGVDHKTITAWKALPQWANDVHNIEALRALGFT